VAKKDDLVTVTLPDGRSALVRAGDLIDPGEPKADCTVVVTKDNQLYQSVGGAWYRLLRTDKVEYATGIAPNFLDKFKMDFPLGREASYTT
jgi:hypothetical protein